MKKLNLRRAFISYRRDDSLDTCGRIHDRLVEEFSTRRVFRDLNSIPLGIDFRDFLKQELENCRVALVIIGPKWADISDKEGQKRLHNPNDIVRFEIETILERNIPVIPVLTQRIEMPDAAGLPLTLRSLTYRNAISVRPDPDFKSDMNRLVESLRPFLGD